MVQNFKECREWVKIKLLKELFLKSLESGSKLNYLRIVFEEFREWVKIKLLKNCNCDDQLLE